MTPREGPRPRAAGALPRARRRRRYFIKFADGCSAPQRRHGGSRHFGALASSGPSLDALEQLIKHVFMPLFGANEESGADAEETGGARRRYAAAKEKGGAGAPRRGEREPSPPPKENVTPNGEMKFRTTVLSPAIAAELASDAGQFGAHVRRVARRLADDVALSFPKLASRWT